ncbi:MAG: histidine--tRNA ligase, partial [Desulfovibrionaceae bacterium]|nr:histidine--tRNA ligase [Desulfovibrionaceae bacterium]
GLVKQLGGPDVPGIGFALGVERLVLLLDQLGKGGSRPHVDLFIAALGSQAQEKAFVLTNILRANGLSVAMDLMDRSLKNQMKQAGKAGARYALILGEQELENGEAVLRNMETHDQENVVIKEDIELWSEEFAHIKH